MKKKQKYKAVFRTRIDFRDKEMYSKRLRREQIYYIENRQEVSYSDIVEEAARIINVELKPELQKYTDMSV